MKDRQAPSKGPQQRIPFLSAILHFLSMPLLVYLRSGFGFSFLSPKGVFIAFAWAQLLFTIYAWFEPDIWVKYWAVACFGIGAVVLYTFHLTAAFSREATRRGEHDFHAGSSHLLKLPGLSQFKGSATFETVIHLWIEPFLTFVIACALGTFLAEHVLSKWLATVSIAMWLKEFFNYWYHLRHEKKERDIYSEAEEKIGNHSGAQAPLPGASGRKAKVKRPANAPSPVDEQEEFRFAQILRLMPPYSLEQAERNYRQLMKENYPAPNEEASEAKNAIAAELNEAIRYFRPRLQS